MLAIALPVPVIVSNFAYYYSREHNRGNDNGDNSDEEIPAQDENVEDKIKDVESGDSSMDKLKCFGKPKIRSRKSKKKDKNKRNNETGSEIEMDLKNGNLGKKDKEKNNDESSKDNDDTEASKTQKTTKNPKNKKPEEKPSPKVTENQLCHQAKQENKGTKKSGEPPSESQDNSETNV